MHTKGEGEFAAVVQVVLDHMPDDPLAREFVWLAPALASKDIVQVFRRPALQALLPGAKGHFQAAHQFGGRWHFAIVLPLGDGRYLWTAFAHQAIQPTGTRADNMPGELANGAEMGSYAELQLLGGKRLDGLDEVTLVDIPAFVESR